MILISTSPFLMLEDNLDLHCDNAKAIQGNILSTQDAQSLASIFKALCDPTRLKILSCLMGGEICVHDISTLLGMSQSSVSNQLRLLRQFYLVATRKEGLRVFYRLDDEHVELLYKIGLEHSNHLYKKHNN